MNKEYFGVGKRGRFKKPTLIIDVDDTLINSSEVTIDLLSEKYEFTDRIKKLDREDIYKELKEWKYYTFFCSKDDPLRLEISREAQNIYGSKKFWDRIYFKQGIDLMFKEFGKSYKWIINSKGTKKNLEYKREWLENNIPSWVDYELVLDIAEWGGKMDKSHLVGDIIVDDRVDVLNSNDSPVKVLLRNYRFTRYNGGFEGHRDDIINKDIYEVDNIKEVMDILRFFKDYKLE